MARWQAHPTYPGIYADAGDARHWRVVVNLGTDEDGQRRRAVRVIDGTLSAARRARTELEGRRDRKQIRPQRAGTPTTVGAWMDYWLEAYKRRHVERSTYGRYCDEDRLYIATTIGHVRLANVSVADVQRFYNALSDRGLHSSTILQAGALLRQGLRAAQIAGLLQNDPMLGAKGPQRVRRPHLVLPSPQDMGTLSAVMRAADANCHAIARFAYFTGMREGELIALEWSAIDFAERVVHVRRSAARVPTNGEGMAYYEIEMKGPKTPESERDIPLSDDLLAWLKEHRARMRELRMSLGPKRWTDRNGDLVFPMTSCFAGQPAGRAWQADTLRKQFHRYTERVGLGHLRFHDLRGVFASHALARGADMATVSRLLGHTKIATTIDTYGHIGEEQKRAAMEAAAAEAAAYEEEALRQARERFVSWPAGQTYDELPADVRKKLTRRR